MLLVEYDDMPRTKHICDQKRENWNARYEDLFYYLGHLGWISLDDEMRILFQWVMDEILAYAKCPWRYEPVYATKPRSQYDNR